MTDTTDTDRRPSEPLGSDSAASNSGVPQGL